MRQIKKLTIVAIAALLCLLGMTSPASAEGYNWRKANTWALYHAQDTQPNFNGCAWFVSNALWYGGLAPDDTWHGRAYRLGWTPVPGTKTATVAEDLYNHLAYTRGMGSEEITDHYDHRNTSVPEARPGDVIAYDWEGDGHVNHVSLVVYVTPDAYPYVSEWGSARNGKVSPYQMRGWSWSSNHGTWQRQIPGQENVHAYLISIR